MGQCPVLVAGRFEADDNRPSDLSQIVSKPVVAYRDSEPQRRPFASATACNSVFMAPLARSIRRPRSPFLLQGWKPCGSLEIGCVDHDGLLICRPSPVWGRYVELSIPSIIGSLIAI